MHSSKTRTYKQNKHTYTQCGAEHSLFQFCPTNTEPFSAFYLEEKVSAFHAVSQLIMRVCKLKVEYKLAIQEKPKGAPGRIII